MNKSDILSSYKTIFWDFDGVIKDSVSVKTAAYGKLFSTENLEVNRRIERHHSENGGMSRFEKIPLYLTWLGVKPTPKVVSEYCELFSSYVFQSVIDSPWVPGVENYLRLNRFNQSFFVVSGTPKNELDRIIENIDLKRCFEQVFGAPTEKAQAIKEVLALNRLNTSDCIMVGDAMLDYEAAEENNISFLLRQHESNVNEFDQCNVLRIEDFRGNE
jgi:phosphoglycolate phosphatase-like HAD superfamily hydrolase